MTIRDHFRAALRDRRAFPRDSLDWQYRTRAARKYLLMLRGVAPNEWRVK